MRNDGEWKIIWCEYVCKPFMQLLFHENNMLDSEIRGKNDGKPCDCKKEPIVSFKNQFHPDRISLMAFYIWYDDNILAVRPAVISLL